MPRQMPSVGQAAGDRGTHGVSRGREPRGSRREGAHARQQQHVGVERGVRIGRGAHLRPGAASALASECRFPAP